MGIGGFELTEMRGAGQAVDDKAALGMRHNA